MKIIVAGGSGFVGKALVRRLRDEKHEVLVLSRRANEGVEWDARTVGAWAAHVDGADAVVNLVGENIAGKRWTKKQKMVLRSSRLDSTRALVEAIGRASNKPKALVNASAVGYYGDVPRGEVSEMSLKGSGFLADLCAEWEAQAQKAEAFGVRVVLLRIGIILEKGGGALEKMLPPFLLFVGGPLGSASQYFPWVHREDVIGSVLFALKETSLSGPCNVTAPGILTMKEFCSELGKVMNRPSWAPVPAFALKVLLGEMAQMVLTGQKAVPKTLLDKGFRFQHPLAGPALASILRR